MNTALIKKDDTNAIFRRYRKVKLVTFPFTLSEDDKGKKRISNMPQNINNITSSIIDKNYNGCMMRMGLEISENAFIIGLDIDNKPDTDDIFNGLTKWRELLNINNYVSFESINTPTQLTGNKGYHYLFSVSAEQLKKIGCSLTNIKIEGKTYSIDVKATNQNLIVEPSSYSSVDKKIKSYTWLKKIGDVNILKLPIWIYNIIIANKINKVIKLPKAELILELKINNEETTEKDINIDIVKLLECIDQKRYLNYSKWMQLGQIFFSNNIPFSYWDNKSKLSPNYKINECKYKWSTFKTKKYKIGTLHYIAKADNPEKYNSIIFTPCLLDNFMNIEAYPQTKINKQYLLDEHKLLNDDKNEIVSLIDNFFINDNIKSLNIKSPYGTGKTQLIKEIIKNYEPKRILWITYRQTLTNNISGEFPMFSSYMDGKYEAEKLICQLESLLHIRNNDDLFIDDESCLIPQYDLIIADEIEGILNHFNSDTFKGKSKEVFNYMTDIIKYSKKLITLDGDTSKRALEFVKPFGEMITINNTYNLNPRTFNIMNQQENFNIELLSAIDDAITENKKVAICSMSKDKTTEYEKLILEHNKDVKILIINSDTNDEDKRLLKNIQQEILKYDVFIYSPSVEAGVNIDIKNCFSRLFGILSDRSTSPRAFCQMLARIRHLINNKITILNTVFKYNKNPYIWNYSEIYDSLKQLKELNYNRTTELINNKPVEKFNIDTFDNNYIHNKLEKLNKNKYYFLSILKMYADAKGIEFMMNDEEKTQKIKPDTIFLNAKILNSDNIIFNSPEYDELYQRRKTNKASDKDKLILKKADIKYLLGVSELDDDILNKYKGNYNFTSSFLNMIDITNIKINSDEKHIITTEKIRICKSLINDMGFNDVFDNKEINIDVFEKSLDTLQLKNDIYTKAREQQGLFNMTKTKPNTTTKKAILGYINSFLSYGHINIKSIKNKISGKYIPSYKLVRLNNVCEIIQYKKSNGFQFNDVNNIFKNIDKLEWAHLIKNDDNIIDTVDIIKHDEIVKQSFIIDFIDE